MKKDLFDITGMSCSACSGLFLQQHGHSDCRRCILWNLGDYAEAHDRRCGHVF